MPVPIGVCTAGGWYSRRAGESEQQRVTRILRDLDLVAAAGLEGIRFDVSWGYGGEPTKGTYQLEQRRQILVACKERGLNRNLMNLGYTPDWARTAKYSGTPNALPRLDAEASFAAYCAAVMKMAIEFGQRWYEVWNELNHEAFMRDPNPVAMARVAALVRAEVRKVNPEARLVFGAFSPAPDLKNPDGTRKEIAPDTYTAELLKTANGHKAFDNISIHPYLGDLHPTDTAHWSMMTDKFPKIRRMLDESGRKGARIWGTEFGFTTEANDGGGRTKYSEAEQASRLVEQVDAWRNLPGAGAGYIFCLRDFLDGGPNGRLNGLGILKANGTPKQSYKALQELLT